MDQRIINLYDSFTHSRISRREFMDELTKIAGSGENTHVVIVEVATPSAEGTFQRELEAASQALFHKSWSDATVRFPELRGFMHAELYTPAGQRPSP